MKGKGDHISYAVKLCFYCHSDYTSPKVKDKDSSFLSQGVGKYWVIISKLYNQFTKLINNETSNVKKDIEMFIDRGV